MSCSVRLNNNTWFTSSPSMLIITDWKLLVALFGALTGSKVRTGESIWTPIYRNIKHIATMHHKTKQTTTSSSSTEVLNDSDYLYVIGKDYYKGKYNINSISYAKNGDYEPLLEDFVQIIIILNKGKAYN